MYYPCALWAHKPQVLELRFLPLAMLAKQDIAPTLLELCTERIKGSTCSGFLTTAVSRGIIHDIGENEEIQPDSHLDNRVHKGGTLGHARHNSTMTLKTRFSILGHQHLCDAACQTSLQIHAVLFQTFCSSVTIL